MADQQSRTFRWGVVALALAAFALVVSSVLALVLLSAHAPWTPEARAEQDRVDAQFNRGLAYWFGTGVLKDPAEAVRWFRMAAEQGHGDAQYMLGSAYVLGEGVRQDDVRAHLWLNIASANGIEHAGSSRDLLERAMTRSEINYAIGVARGCMDSNYRECGGLPGR